MKNFNSYRLRRALAVLTAGLAFGGLAGTASAQQDMYRMDPAISGGVPAQAVLNTPVISGTNVTLSWYGLEGWYTVQGEVDGSGPWNNLATVPASTHATTLTLPANGNTLFQLSQANAFAGSSACGGCHGDKFDGWRATAHSTAVSSILKPDGSFTSSHANASCLPCHTTGDNQPTGYTYTSNSASYTSPLANVGCENCHGAAGWHKNSDHALIQPAVSIAPEICGSCHQGHNPQYTEYMDSLHSQVNDDVKYGLNSGVFYTNTINLVIKGKTWVSQGYYVSTNASTGVVSTNPAVGIINSTNPIVGYDRATSCGVCHSGAMRMAMINDYTARLSGITNALALPTPNDAGAWGPTCADCHDPHGLNPSPVFTLVTNIVPSVSTNTAMRQVMPQYLQLRNPTWSSNYYTMPSLSDKRVDSTGNPYYLNTTFASLYDPNVNVCGQCHNTRGARWDGRAYGLITNTFQVTNLVVSAAYTNSYTTNYNTYGQIVGVTTNSNPTGGIVTNAVVATVKAVTTGLTTTTNGFSRPPHGSPQYNMLIGILQPDYLNTTNGKTVWTNSVLNNGIGIYATHSGIAPRSVYNTNQCATCHVPSYTTAAGNVSGHTFDMDPNGCALGGCHTSGYPDYVGYQISTTNTIASVVDLLNRWATNNAPAIFTNYSKYLRNSWEYTTPGALASVTNAGPSTADQLRLPAVIQQARFNVYMAFNDGSFGVHNPAFTSLLLKDAESKVLSQFTTAKFVATSTTIAPGATVTFNELNPSVTNCVWDFGDGSATVTTTATNITHQYTSVGSWSVSLTATDSNGNTETLTRNNYIDVYTLPTPSFTYTPSTLTHPVKVSFTNTSANAEYAKWSLYDASGSMTTTHRLLGVSGMTTSFTYTNAGSYPVVLQASSPGGSASVTNTIVVQ